MKSIAWNVYVIVSAIVVIALCILNFEYYSHRGSIENRVQLDASLFFINGYIIAFLVIPWVFRVLQKIDGNKIIDFIALHEKDTSVNFPVISTFFGEQAFGSLFATILIFFSKDVYQATGVIGLGFYLTIMALPIIIYMSISLLRMISSFLKFTLVKYFVSSLLACLFMFGMLFIGILLGR